MGRSNKTGSFIRFICCSDNHGDMWDRDVVKAFLDFNSAFKADVRIHLGDLCDLRALRSKATPEEKQESMRHDWNAGMNFLAAFNPHILMKGNHDYRADHWAETKTGVEKDFAIGLLEEFSKATKNMRVYPYCKRHGLHRIGKLAFVHGISHGVGAARKHAFSYGHCVFGHTHSIDTSSVERDDGAIGHNIGCLCKLDMGYNAAALGTLRQAHGWAYGIINKGTGDYYLCQARKIGGQWITPEIG